MKATHHWAKKIDCIIFKIMWGISALAGVSLVVVALLCTVDAFGAKLFSSSVPNGTEWVTYLNIPVVFLAIAFIQIERGHTTVDLLSSKFPKWLRKVISTIGNLLGIFISGYVGMCEWRLMLDKMRTAAKASSSANSFVIWPFACIVALGFFLLMVSFIWCLIREFVLEPQERMGALPMPEKEEQKEEEKHE